jgi:hypothetical protein
MKIVFKKHLEKEEDEKGEEEKTMKRLITLVAYDLATEKRGLKKEGYRYIYFTNPLRHRNFRGNTYILELDDRETWAELKYTFIGKRASFFNICGVLEFANIYWERSSENELALLFNTKGKWIIDPEKQKNELAEIKLELYEYHTSTPKEWGLKWYEELKPCYTFHLTKYTTDYNINSLPLISSGESEEEIRNDIKKCAVIYDHLRKQPRALVKYNDTYISNPNPPWWVEEQLR